MFLFSFLKLAIASIRFSFVRRLFLWMLLFFLPFVFENAFVSVNNKHTNKQTSTAIYNNTSIDIESAGSENCSSFMCWEEAGKYRK